MAHKSNVVELRSGRMLNRRRNSRSASRSYAILKEQTGNRVIRCLVQNVSMGGVRVVTEPYVLAEREFILTMADDGFSTKVRAVWNDLVHIGFEFASPPYSDPANRRTLQQTPES